MIVIIRTINGVIKCISYSTSPPDQVHSPIYSWKALPLTYLVSGANGTLNSNVLSISDRLKQLKLVVIVIIRPYQLDQSFQWSTPTTLSDFSIPDKTLLDDDFNLTPPTSNRTGTIYYTSSNPQVAIVSGTFVIIGVGDVTVTQNTSVMSHLQVLKLLWETPMEME